MLGYKGKERDNLWFPHDSLVFWGHIPPQTWPPGVVHDPLTPGLFWLLYTLNGEESKQTPGVGEG